eukprot:symbB.v1.2.033208.t1/scaffold4089.1/size46570/1
MAGVWNVMAQLVIHVYMLESWCPLHDLGGPRCNLPGSEEQILRNSLLVYIQQRSTAIMAFASIFSGGLGAIYFHMVKDRVEGNVNEHWKTRSLALMWLIIEIEVSLCGIFQSFIFGALPLWIACIRIIGSIRFNHVVVGMVGRDAERELELDMGTFFAFLCEFPVNYASDWAKNRKPWEVWLDAFDAWDHERKRLCEVYLRKAEAGNPAMDAGYAGKFPQAPQMPESMVALYQAAYDGDVVKLADMLEDEEVDLCCKDHNLQTPTMFAAQGGSLECVEYLVDMGADLAAVDRNKDTAYDIAIREHAERSPHHPVLRYFQSVKAPKKG